MPSLDRRAPAGTGACSALWCVSSAFGGAGMLDQAAMSPCGHGSNFSNHVDGLRPVFARCRRPFRPPRTEGRLRVAEHVG